MNEILATIAPTVASALLGPLGGVAVAGLGKIFGLDNATQKDIAKVITDGKMTADQLAEIKKLEMQYQAEEAERGFKYAELQFKTVELDVKDREGARNREINVKDKTNMILAYTIVGSFIAMVAGTLLGYAKVESVLAGTLVGYLSAKAEQVLAYYFGSSSSSQQKTALLANSVPIDSHK